METRGGWEPKQNRRNACVREREAKVRVATSLGVKRVGGGDDRAVYRTSTDVIQSSQGGNAPQKKK